MVCTVGGAAECDASAARARQGLDELLALARDPAALRARREAMIEAWEAWDWPGELSRRLEQL